MTTGAYEISERPKYGGGCYVSKAMALVMVILVVAIVVGVALLVHFANRTTVTCQCPQSTGGQADKIQQCVTWAEGGDMEICEACKRTTITTSPTTTPTPKVKDVRLPRSTYPVYYDLELQPNIYDGPAENFTFKGHVRIHIMCMESTNNITLHTNKLDIVEGSVKLEAESGVATAPSVVRWNWDKDRQFMVIHLDDKLMENGIYVLEMNFTGPLKGDLTGFYLSSYKRNGADVHLATSMFAPTDARKCFPSYDEPAIKSYFNVTLVRKAHMTSLSNMPIARQEDRGEGWMADVYQTSPKMSTYLLAFVVSDFHHLNDTTTNNVLYRTWARPGSVSQTQLALDIGTQIITYFEDYFAIRFPLPKQDMIAIPDSVVGAMENWGLITYREGNMLYQPGVSSPGNKQRVATIVSHELAHQWFGDLVTPSWWDDIWLNEGFASFVEYMGTDHLYPEWKMIISLTYMYHVAEEHPKRADSRGRKDIEWMWGHRRKKGKVRGGLWSFERLKFGQTKDLYWSVLCKPPQRDKFEQFVVNDLQYVFNIDGLVSSHPVYQPVSHPDEINQIFDTISYNKGASIIRMMRFFLGEETFRVGLNKYLTSRAYGAAFHDDLWQALTQQSAIEGKNVNVKEVMDTWILQMNFPVVMVTRQNDGTLTVIQERYVVDPSAQDPGQFISPFGYRWEIPFTFTSSKENKFDKTDADITWIKRTDTEVTITNPGVVPDQADDSTWVIGNTMQYGYYRVNYDEQNWKAIIHQLKTQHTRIHSINRAQIINDAWNLAKSGMLSQDVALQTVEYLDKEMDYVPWKAANRELGYVDTMLSRTELYGAFKEFMKRKTTTTFSALGMNNTGSDHLQSYVRSLIAGTACGYGVTACTDEAKQLFSQWMGNPTVNPIDPGVKSTVYCSAISHGGVDEWDFAFTQYKSSSGAEATLLLAGMSCSAQPWILSRYLNWALSAEKIRKQDALSVLSNVGGNPVGQGLVWSFFRERWTDIKRDHGSTIFALARAIPGITSGFNTQFQLNELESFIQANSDLGTGARAFQQAVEKTKSNIKWMTQNLDTVKSWLQNQGLISQ